jgi:tRNA(Arg) A34 adenosine deaminase TadA
MFPLGPIVNQFGDYAMQLLCARISRDSQMNATDQQFLRRAIEVARRARARGNHPFGAVLVSAKGESLLEAENSVVTDRDATGHAETNLVRTAFRQFDRDFLATCTLFTSTEPCAMCAGAIYWSNIGRVVFGLSEARLAALAGSDPENLTLLLPCREVFARGRRPVEVLGPALEEEAEQVHDGFWKRGRG